MNAFRTAALAATILLGACASFEGSYVDPRVASDPPSTNAIAAQVVDVCTLAVPAGAALTLMPPPDDQETNAATPAIAEHLTAAKFVLAAEGIPLVYRVTPLREGVALRVHLNGATASRFFAPDPIGRLVPAGPLVLLGAS